MGDFKFEIEKNFGELSESPKGWKKEFNLVSFNGREAKYDIREWDPEHEKMSKGLTFTKEEITKLKDLLNKLDI
jgi:hypothetical protein